jgi:nitrite reductase (NO-forming)
VRFYFVNAAINEASALHPIAGIWDRVWDNGNPKNIRYGMQTVEIGPAHGMILDMVPPAGRASNNAIVDHRMKNAMKGAITVLMTSDEADEKKGHGDQLILR